MGKTTNEEEGNAPEENVIKNIKLRQRRKSQSSVVSSTSTGSRKRIRSQPHVPELASSNKRKRRSEIKEVAGDDVSYTLLRSSGAVADWDDFLRDTTAVPYACPVNYFKHAPFASQWTSVAIAQIGCKIELPHPWSISESPIYCVATILSFAGYKVFVRFENSANTQHTYAWISYCSDKLKPLGYSIENNYLVLPVEGTDGTAINPIGSGIVDNTNLKFMEQIYTESNAAIQFDYDKHKQLFNKQLAKNKYQSKFQLNEIIEVMDKRDPVRNRLANIIAIIGDRIQVRYLGGHKGDQGFCFNVQSELVHPLGWSQSVGQSLLGIPSDFTGFTSVSKTSFQHLPKNVRVKPGMVFELRHPFFPFKIVTGAVKRKLKHGYFIAKIESNDQRYLAEFVFHVSSDYVLPCGFSNKHKIDFEKPPGEDETFSWSDYFKKKQVQPLLQESIHQKMHNFVKGCKFEAVDVFEPMYLGPATVLNVAGHLLYIHFDGWPRTQIESYQWISAFSCDIYPLGWAELVHHCFQGHAELPQPYDSMYIDNSRNLGLAN